MRYKIHKKLQQSKNRWTYNCTTVILQCSDLKSCKVTQGSINVLLIKLYRWRWYGNIIVHQSWKYIHKPMHTYWHIYSCHPYRHVLVKKHAHARTHNPRMYIYTRNCSCDQRWNSTTNLKTQVHTFQMQWHLELGFWFSPITSSNEMDTYFCSVDIP